MNEDDRAGWDGVAGCGKGIIVGEPWEMIAGDRGWQLELREDRPEEDEDGGGTVLLAGCEVREETERARLAVDEDDDVVVDDDLDGPSFFSSFRCRGGEEDLSGRVRFVSSFPLGL